MKAFKKVFAVSVAAALACVLFAACGDSEEEAPVNYTVSFDVNGGALTEGASASVTVKQGESITLPAAAKEDYILSGWYLGTQFIGLASASYTPTASVTLKAEWENNLPTVDYAAENTERAVEYAKQIHDLYWDSTTHLSKLTPNGGTPFLWPYTEQVSMVNGILNNMEESDEDYAFFTGYLEELLDGLRYYRIKAVTGDVTWQNSSHTLATFGETDGTANSYAIYNSGRDSSQKDNVTSGMDGIFFDDNIWVAKEFYFAYLNLGQEKYLNEAVNIVNWIIGEGYEEAADLNGIYWNWAARYKFEYKNGTGLDDNIHASLNSCSSAPTAMMLAKLYQTLNGEGLKTKFETLAQEYLTKAGAIYEFCYGTLRNPSNGCLRDKIFLKEGFEDMTGDARIELVDAQILPYNTGTHMTAGAELYKIYSEKSDGAGLAKIYNKRNQAVVEAADKYFANTQVVQGQYSYHENSWFTSFILEGFIDIDETGIDCGEYVEHMRSALDYAWKNHRAEDKLVCPAWIEGWNKFSDSGVNSEGNPRQILLQSANAHCYAMLAGYYAL